VNTRKFATELLHIGQGMFLPKGKIRYVNAGTGKVVTGLRFPCYEELVLGSIHAGLCRLN